MNPLLRNVFIAFAAAIVAVGYQLKLEADRSSAIPNVGLANNSINYSDKKDLKRIINGTYNHAR